MPDLISLETINVSLRQMDLSVSIRVLPEDPHGMKAHISELGALLALSASCKANMVGHKDNAQAEALRKLLDNKNYAKLGATQLKQLVDGECARINKMYVHADRLNAAITHKIEMCRTLLSTYKTELDKGIHT